MGPAIRKAIVETVRGMLESTNRAIEASLSVQGVRWRIEAWRSGKSFAEIVLLHSLVYRVEQLLLIHKETGLLLRQVVASDAEAQDPDMVSGMLTAIRDFVRDSFGGKSGDSLDVFQVGELEVLVEDSPRAVLAAVVRGHPPPELRVELERALEAIEARFGTALDGFGGDTAPFDGAKDALESCLRARYDEKHPRGRGAVRMVWLAAAVIATLLIGWLVWWRADHRRWTRAIAALDAAPGLVVTGSERHAGAVEIAGLRDPLAEEPLAILGRAGVDPGRARLALEPYQSLEDEIVARRRSQELRLELDAIARRVEATPILMKLDTTEILSESLVWVPGLVRDEQRNDLLSNRRADHVRDLLIERGLPADLVSTRGVAARDFSGDPEAENDLRLNRRVNVRVRIGSAPGGIAP
jgi:OOP family OmpA-OmpF porin